VVTNGILQIGADAGEEPLIDGCRREYRVFQKLYTASRAASYSPASPSSPSEAGSPLSRCSITSTSNAQTNSKSHPSYAHEMQTDAPVRAPMNRLTSSAILFFGQAGRDTDAGHKRQYESTFQTRDGESAFPHE